MPTIGLLGESREPDSVDAPAVQAFDPESGARHCHLVADVREAPEKLENEPSDGLVIGTFGQLDTDGGLDLVRPLQA